MKKIGICYHTRFADARRLAKELAKALEGRGAQAWLCAAWDDVTAQHNMPGTDLLVSVGGDGSMLWAARSAVAHDTPILGVRMGRVAFLAELGPAEVLERLPEVLEGSGRIEERTMLQAEVLAPAPSGEHYHALNDVVVARGSVGRPVYLALKVDGADLARFRADGVVIATATGSTAYALSAGGPVLYPDGRDLLVMPLAPHLATSRAVVLPPSCRVEVMVAGDPPAVMSIDGQIDKELAVGDGVRVSSSPYLARFLRLGGPQDFYGQVGRRLAWFNSTDLPEL